jgi:hypothetical protein
LSEDTAGASAAGISLILRHARRPPELIIVSLLGTRSDTPTERAHSR